MIYLTAEITGSNFIIEGFAMFLLQNYFENEEESDCQWPGNNASISDKIELLYIQDMPDN